MPALFFCLQMRFASALGASLVLHLIIGLIPTGQLSFEGKPGQPSLAGGAAPLWVNLGKGSRTQVLLARTAPSSGTRLLPSPKQTVSAAALASTDRIPLIVDPRGESPATEVTGGEPGLPEPYYFSSSEVSDPARVLSGVEGIPEALARDVDSGRMIVKLFINESGTVDRLVVENNELKRYMEKVLTEQFRHARFTPAIKDNQPVKTRLRLEITLQPPPPFLPAR